jgi:hypothetical protein
MEDDHMIRRVLWLAGFLLVLFPWAHADGATFIVAQGHPQAGDDNPGTPERPLKTIAKAAGLVQPGDTVLVRAGVYRECIPFQKSGTAEAPISFVAEPMGSAVVTGADPITGWEKVPGDAPIYRVPWNHQFIIAWDEGVPVEHHPGDAPLWGRAEQVIVDSKQALPSLTLADLTRAWHEHSGAIKEGKPSPVLRPPVANLGGPFAGMFAADTRQKKELYLWLADGSDPNKHGVEASTRGALFGVNPWANPKGVQHVRLCGLLFRYGATFPQRPAVWMHGGNNLAEHCVIEDMAGGGIGVNGTLRHCIIRNCGQTGGGAGGTGFLNEDSLWEGNCWKPINRGWDAGGFKLAWANGGVFRRCLFRRNGGPGLWFDIHVRNVTVAECGFQENEGSGLFIEISRDISVTRNLAVGNGSGVVGKLGFEAWSTGGIHIAESENCLVAFNTCVGNKDGITFREQGPRPLKTEDFGEVPYHNLNHVVFGNVCAFNKGYQLGIWYDNAFFGWHPAEKEKYKTEEAYNAFLKTIPERIYDPTKQGLVIDRNVYLGSDDGPLVLYGVPWRPRHKEFKDLKSFTEHTGFDSRSQVGDPLFVNAGAGDYRFRPESPAWRMQAGWLACPSSMELLAVPTVGAGARPIRSQP